MKAIRFFYYTLGDHLWERGIRIGLYDAFDPTEGWWGPILTLLLTRGRLFA